MNYKLLLLLSLAGIPTGIVQLFNYWHDPITELLVMLIVAAAIACIVAKFAPRRLFLMGFLISIIGGAWQNAIYMIFYGTEAAQHPQFVASFGAGDPRMPMLAMFAATDVAQGIVLGFFCFIAGKIVENAAEPNP